jgi:hypothetical protein
MLLDAIKFVAAAFVVIVVSALLVSTPYIFLGSYNVTEIDKRAPEFLATHGLKIIGREGYQSGLIYQPGGCVYFTMKSEGDPKTVYHGCVSKWHNGTFELWNLSAVNAISTQK